MEIAERHDLLVIEDSIPAGCSLMPNSIKGSYDSFQQVGNRLIFFVTNSYYGSRKITYQLIPEFEGSYKSLVGKMYYYHQPDNIVHSSSKRINIHNADYNTFKNYKLSPDEKLMNKKVIMIGIIYTIAF